MDSAVEVVVEHKEVVADMGSAVVEIADTLAAVEEAAADTAASAEAAFAVVVAVVRAEAAAVFAGLTILLCLYPPTPTIAKLGRWRS